MPLPTAQNVYDYLEGYGINSLVVSTTWIENQRDEEIVPYVEHQLGYSIDAEQTVTEYHSGNGQDTLILNNRNITELVSIELVRGSDISGAISLSSLELITDKGIIKARSGYPEYYIQKIFPAGQNNIKVTYKIGSAYPTDLMLAVKMLTAIAVLQNISSRTGGGDLSVQGFSRNYGGMGRYTVIIKQMDKRAHNIISKYRSSVIGS